MIVIPLDVNSVSITSNLDIRTLAVIAIRAIEMQENERHMNK